MGIKGPILNCGSCLRIGANGTVTEGYCSGTVAERSLWNGRKHREQGNIVEWYVWKQANLGRVSGECGGIPGGDANLSKQRKGLNSWVIKKFKKRVRVE